MGGGSDVTGCSDLAGQCKDENFGESVSAACPVTCNACDTKDDENKDDENKDDENKDDENKDDESKCEDDDQAAIALAKQGGFDVSGCSDLAGQCKDENVGESVSAACPVTCNACDTK